MTPAPAATPRGPLGARRWHLLGLALLALAVRLHAAWVWNATRPNSAARLRGDERGYDSLAIDLVAGLGITWPGRTPLYPLWLAAVRLATNGSYDAVPYVQAVVGAVAAPLTYLLARRYFGPGTALAAGLWVAVFRVLVQQSLLFQSEVLFTPMVLVVALSLDDALRGAGREGAARRFAWAGLAIGVSDLIRPTLILFPAVVALAAVLRAGVRRGARLALVQAAVVALVIAPWMARNWYRYHAVLPLATSNAILWQGSPEYYHLTHDRGYTYLDVWEKVIYGGDDDAPDPGEIEGEAYWRARAIRSIRAEPLVYLRYAAEKAVTYWTGDHNADWGDTHVFNARALQAWGLSRREIAETFVARLLVFPALLAAVLLRRRWRELLPVYALLVYATLLHAATHAEARLSDPFQPLLIVLVTGAAATLLGGRRRARAAPLTPP